MEINSSLQVGSTLQGGKYRIIRTLGRGGFGITYEAEHTLLGQTVALKEFFMKDICNRDTDTSHVSVPSMGSQELANKFKEKFVKEARMIFGLNHPNIIRVLDVFEENGTAYYVMEHLSGGSLSDKVKNVGPMPEGLAGKYIRQVADALAYIHARNMVHLDVKPSNVLLSARGDAVLIDFGISKHYDSSGQQTSSTPVGISKGYAPLEQYQQTEITTFTPATDIYSLGATLYTLLSGEVPPSASEVNEDGLERPEGISDRAWQTIEKAMQPRRKSRPQHVVEFLALLDGPSAQAQAEDDAETVIAVKPTPKPGPAPKPAPTSVPPPKPLPDPPGRKSKTWLWALLVGVVIAGVVLGVLFGGKRQPTTTDKPALVTPSMEEYVPEAQSQTQLQTQPKPQTQSQTQSKSVPEVPATGSVKVSSTPSGAIIWLDGKNTRKTTPDVVADLTPGKHTVKLVLDGYDSSSGSVTVVSGKQAAFSRNLSAVVIPLNVAPKFQGGDVATFSLWVSKNLKYPTAAMERGAQGQVVVDFIIETDGSVSNVMVANSVDPDLDKEAIRVVKSSPKWTPGQKDGHDVRISYQIPVTFKLE